MLAAHPSEPYEDSPSPKGVEAVTRNHTTHNELSLRWIKCANAAPDTAPEVREKSGGPKAEYDSEEEDPQETEAHKRAHKVGRVLRVRNLDDFLESFWHLTLGQTPRLRMTGTARSW